MQQPAFHFSVCVNHNMGVVVVSRYANSRYASNKVFFIYYIFNPFSFLNCKNCNAKAAVVLCIYFRFFVHENSNAGQAAVSVPVASMLVAETFLFNTIFVFSIAKIAIRRQ